MIPDAEGFVGTYLREHPDIVALDARVSTELPRSFTKPWVKVTQLDDNAVNGSRTDWLIEYLLQFDCYAASEGGSVGASIVSRTVRAALRDMPLTTLDDAVVTGVEFISAPRVPDDSFEPARERYVRSVTIWAHPKP